MQQLILDVRYLMHTLGNTLLSASAKTQLTSLCTRVAAAHPNQTLKVCYFVYEL